MSATGEKSRVNIQPGVKKAPTLRVVRKVLVEPGGPVRRVPQSRPAPRPVSADGALHVPAAGISLSVEEPEARASIRTSHPELDAALRGLSETAKTKKQQESNPLEGCAMIFYTIFILIGLFGAVCALLSE